MNSGGEGTARGRERPTAVLVVDADDAVHAIAAAQLGAHRVVHAHSAWQALDVARRELVDVVVVDLALPDRRGPALLDELGAGDRVEVIVVAAEPPLAGAVEAIKRGAFDVLPKCDDTFARLDEHVARALEHRRERRELAEATADDEWLEDAFALLEASWSPALQAVLRLVRQVAPTPAPVLIEGEPGAGKEVLARYVHALSDRADAPLVTIKVAAIPPRLSEARLFGQEDGAGFGGAREGAVELAGGGTLLLDEVADLSPAAQRRLLRLLDEGVVERVGARAPTPVDVRVIAATSRILAAEVTAGRFRDDLYHRLAAARLHVPPLRERKPDFSGLARLLVSKHAALAQREPPTLGADALEVLKDCTWPGNVRELEELARRLVSLRPGGTVVADDLPPDYCLPTLGRLAARKARRRPTDRGLYFSAREQFERYLVRLMVDRNGGDIRAAARALGIGLTTAKDKLKGARADWLDEL